MTRHAFRRAAGQCYRCGADKGAPYCARCRHTRNQARAVARAERAERGKCPLCGTRRPVGGANCRTCQEANNGYSRVSHRRRRATSPSRR